MIFDYYEQSYFSHVTIGTSPFYKEDFEDYVPEPLPVTTYLPTGTIIDSSGRRRRKCPTRLAALEF